MDKEFTLAQIESTAEIISVDGTLQFKDFDYMKSVIKNATEIYKSVIVTEDQIKKFTDDKALLNKIDKKLNDKKIAEKKKATDLLENQYKELSKEIKEASDNLSIQLTVYDNQVKKLKSEAIEKMYEEEFKDSPLNLQELWEDRWLNKSESLESISSSISQKLDSYKQDLITLHRIYSDDTVLEEAIKTLRASKSITEAIRKGDEVKEILEKANIEVKETKKEETPQADTSQEIDFNDVIFHTYHITTTSAVEEAQLEKLLYSNGFTFNKE